MKIQACGHARVLVSAAWLLFGFAAAAQPSYGIMNCNNGWLQQWQADAAAMPVYQAPTGYPGLPGSVNLLPHLHYLPELRDQGHTGTCWLWGCTAVMAMDFDIKKGGTPILTNGFSVQFAVSYGRFVDTSINEGGTPQTVKRFYDGVGYCVPWGNTNAAWTDGNGVNKTPSAWIQTEPRHPVGAIAISTVHTYELAEADAIANIKSALDARHPLWFNFLLANGADWQVFFDYWGGASASESAVIDLAYGKDHNMVLTTGGGHIVACVGYDDQDPDPAKHYWLMLNSWGTASGLRPNGLFRMAMHTDYSARLQTAPGYYTPMFTWGLLDSEFPADLDKGVKSLDLNLPRATPGAGAIQINGVSFPREQTPTNVVAAILEMNDRCFTCNPTTGAWQPTASGFHFQSAEGVAPALQLDINTNTLLWSMAIANADEDRYIDPHDGIYFTLACSPTDGMFLPPLGGLRAFAYDELSGGAAQSYTNKPTLTITGPTAGTLVSVGRTNTITWTSSGLAGATLVISITSDNDSAKVADYVPAEAGQYQWVTPWDNWTNANCRVSIKVEGDGSGADWKGPTFSMVTNPTPTVVLHAPAGGERWPLGATRSVSWDAYNVSGNLTLEVLCDGSVVDTVPTIAAAAGRCHYAIPAGLAIGTNYTIRLTSASAPPAVAASQPFSLVGQALTPKPWTILFYMDADCSTVGPAQLNDLVDLGQLGSSSNINYVCQMDRVPGYTSSYGNWYDTRRFYLTKGMLPTPENACQALGELNMSRPETLTDFINWAADNYPAQNYFLVLADHGNGWRGGLVTDETSGGTDMPTLGLQRALEQADTRMSILGLDMCLEGDVEVAYQVRHSGPQVFIASQYQETRDWPYRSVFAQLEAKLDQMTLPGLAALFCASFVAQYTNTADPATLSAIQLDKLDPLTTAIAGFADAMVSDYKDTASVRQQAENVKSAFNDAVFYCAKSKALQQQVYGLNLFFPTNAAATNDYNSDYVDFPAASHWAAFLSAYYQRMTDSWISQARLTASSDNSLVDLFRFCDAISPSTNTVRVTFASVGNGGTLPIANNSVYATNGQTLIIQATPIIMFGSTNHFVRWVGDASGQIADPFAAETTLRVTGDTLVLAYFSEDKATYKVTFVTEGNGSLNGTNLITTEVLAGHDCPPVIALPDTGYAFCGWGGDFPASGNPLTLSNIQMDTTVIAFFWPAPPTLSIERSGANVRLAWPLAPGYVLESAGSLTSDPWTPVPGVTTNSVTVPCGSNLQYFRLRQTNDQTN